MNDKKVLCQLPLNDQQHRKLKMWAAYKQMEINEVLSEALDYFIRLRRKNLPETPLYILPLKGSRARSCWLSPETTAKARQIAEEDEVTVKAVMLMATYEYLLTTQFKDMADIDESV